MTRTFALTALLLSLAPSAFAQATPVALATLGVNESGTVVERTRRAWFDTNGDFIPQCLILNAAANGECNTSANLTPSISFAVAADPGPGGLTKALIYTLPLSLPAPTQGDVILEDASTGDLDVIRFNGDRTVVFYSGALPSLNYANSVAINKGMPRTAYVPHAGQPGFGYSIIGGTMFATDYLTYALVNTPAADMLINLTAAASNLDFQQAEHLLLSALGHFNDGHLTPACDKVEAFVDTVQAQAGKKLTVAQADWLMLQATNAMTAMGCQ